MYHECEAPDCDAEAEIQAEGGEWYCLPHFEALGTP